MAWFSRLFEKCQKYWKEPVKTEAVTEAVKTVPKAPYLTETVVFGMHRYRTANEDSTVIFVDEARGIRKMLVDSEGRFQNFPGIVKEDFWAKYVEARDLQPQIRFRTSFEKREDRWIVLWEVQPDGRYWADDDGYGMTNDEETHLYTYVDMDGNFTGPFRIYDMGIREYYKPELRRYSVSKATQLPGSFREYLEKWRQELCGALENGCSGGSGSHEVTFFWRSVHYAVRLEDVCGDELLKEYGSDACGAAFDAIVKIMEEDLKEMGARQISAEGPAEGR